MADKKAPGRPKRTAVETNKDFPSIETKNEGGELLGDKGSKEKSNDQGKSELEKLREENAKLKEEKTASKVVEVTINKPKEEKESKERLPRQRYQTHTVYVAKKKGDDFGPEQTREMSEQAYNAIAKDLSLKVRLPNDSRLVEPQSKGCKDC